MRCSQHGVITKADISRGDQPILKLTEIAASGSRIKALMVDMDGVLIHGRPDDGSHWGISLETDLGLRREDFQKNFFDVYWTDIVVGRAGLMDHLPPVLERIAPHLSAERLIAYWFAHDARLDRDLLQDLEHVRTAGVPVYLATNQGRMRAQYLMETVGLARYVDGVYYSAALGAKKPDRAFFEKVVSRTGIEPGSLLLIDDALSNVDAVLAPGWKAIHWTRGQVSSEVR